MIPKVARPVPPSMFGSAGSTNMSTGAALSLHQILSSPALMASFHQSQRQMPFQYGALPLFNGLTGVYNAPQQLYQQPGLTSTQQGVLTLNQGLLASVGGCQQNTPFMPIMRSFSNPRQMATMDALRAKGMNDNTAAAHAALGVLRGNGLR